MKTPPLNTEGGVFKVLLGKYIDAKIKAGQLIQEKQVMLENIDYIIKQCIDLNQVLTQYSNALDRSSQVKSSYEANDLMMVRRSPGSNIVFRLLKMYLCPRTCLVVQLELTIKDGVVSGTNYCLEDFVKNLRRAIKRAVKNSRMT